MRGQEKVLLFVPFLRPFLHHPHRFRTQAPLPRIFEIISTLSLVNALVKLSDNRVDIYRHKI